MPLRHTGSVVTSASNWRYTLQLFSLNKLSFRLRSEMPQYWLHYSFHQKLINHTILHIVNYTLLDF